MARKKSRPKHLRPWAQAAILTTLVVANVGAESLTLDRAIAMARQRAREIIAAEARQLASEANVDRAKAHRWPQISLSQVWLRTDAPAEVFGLELQQERFSFEDFVASDPNHPDALSNFMTRLELRMPIYTGGELSARIEQAELALLAAGETVSRTADQAALAAAEAFVQLAQARQQMSLLERSLATAEAHVELAQAYVEQGMLVTSELLRAEVERARLADLLAAAQGQARVAEAALSFRLSAELSNKWQLTPLADPDELDQDLEAWLRQADQRADLKAARQQQRIAALEVEVSRAARRPRIGLSARYELFDEQLFGIGGDNTTVMAMASIDLFAGGRHRAARQAAQAGSEAVSADVDRFAEGVQLEIRQAHAAALSARDRFATAGQAVTAATEAERIVEERYRQGIEKTTDLIDAASARHQAESRELLARTDAHLATLRLAVAAGHSPESVLSPASFTATPRISGAASHEER